MQGHAPVVAGFQLDRSASPGKAVFCQTIEIGEPRRERISAFAVRPETHTAGFFIDVKHRPLRRKRKLHRGTCRLVDGNGIVGRVVKVRLILYCDRDTLRISRSAECDGNRFARLHTFIVDQQRVAAVRFAVPGAVSCSKRQLQRCRHLRNRNDICLLRGKEAGSVFSIMEDHRTAAVGDRHTVQGQPALQRHNIVRRIGNVFCAAGSTCFGCCERQRISIDVSKQDRIGKLFSLCACSRNVLHSLPCAVRVRICDRAVAKRTCCAVCGICPDRKPSLIVRNDCRIAVRFWRKLLSKIKRFDRKRRSQADIERTQARNLRLRNGDGEFCILIIQRKRFFRMIIGVLRRIVGIFFTVYQRIDVFVPSFSARL